MTFIALYSLNVSLVLFPASLDHFAFITGYGAEGEPRYGAEGESPVHAQKRESMWFLFDGSQYMSYLN